MVPVARPSRIAAGPTRRIGKAAGLAPPDARASGEWRDPPAAREPLVVGRRCRPGSRAMISTAESLWNAQHQAGVLFCTRSNPSRVGIGSPNEDIIMNPWL